MPYIKGMGYLKTNGRFTRSTMVRRGLRTSSKKRLSRGLLLRGPGGVAHINRKVSVPRFSNRTGRSFMTGRNLLRKYFRV